MSICPTCSGIIGWDCQDQELCRNKYEKKHQNKKVLINIKHEIQSLIDEKHSSDNSSWQYKCNNSLEHLLEIMHNMVNHNDFEIVQ